MAHIEYEIAQNLVVADNVRVLFLCLEELAEKVLPAALFLEVVVGQTLCKLLEAEPSSSPEAGELDGAPRPREPGILAQEPVQYGHLTHDSKVMHDTLSCLYQLHLVRAAFEEAKVLAKCHFAHDIPRVCVFGPQLAMAKRARD